ncbi:MAG: efflux RND transporter periplasmic adaptor subunit [Alphaproteobacteria bacterium]|nr:efflux RND transporter periplasmic adaptor subunit [Alphaproteobacteria bacterium]MDY4689424.1 efflux RND transporter periplasmic adaptor subunit [Alphaproteobacteria bacterium]
MRKYLIYGIALLAIFGIGYKMLNRSAGGTVYKTQKIENGDIMESITASGTINPLSTVSVGSQASGRIAEIYVDYNSVVKKGQLLALIDQENAKATVQQREAALEIAKAQVAVEENNIKYYKKALNRISKLNASKYSTEKDLEAAERDYDNSVAQLALEQAQVKQAQASLNSAQTELSYTEIKAPVDGIVISKAVEVGQTVAASFETPEIFSVAEDLTKMQIEASVVEADIAKVKEGQKVRFTVDSYADDYFYGVVTQVRNEATTTSNVVTYTVVIGIDNTEMKLKPGMTANVEIITAEEKDVMLVPNQALRFYIDDSDNAKRYKDRGVWIMKNGKPERVTVKIGVSDDDNTQILESSLKIGDAVIIGKELSAADTQKMRLRMPR